MKKGFFEKLVAIIVLIGIIGSIIFVYVSEGLDKLQENKDPIIDKEIVSY